MSYYILIRGPLGIGKSTISQELAKRLNAEYIPVDIVLEKYGLDKVDKDAECIPAQNFNKAIEKILPAIKEKLANGQIAIFDACFYHKETIEYIIKNLAYPHYVFTLKAPLDVCIERDSKRKKSHGKDAAGAVHYLVSKFDYGTIIDISKKNIEQTIQEILSYLPKQ